MSKLTSISLSPDQEGALALLLSPSWPSQVIFLTGKAGTGKSLVLREFSKRTKLASVVLAPTGLAALAVGGQTIHSFFRLPIRPIPPDDPDLRAGGRDFASLLEALDCVVIDEVSMVRADVLDAVDRVLRLNLRSDLPFGGKRLLLVGDVMQLEPVVTEDQEEFMADTYASPFFFDSRVVQTTGCRAIELTVAHRQANDDAFAAILDQVRVCDCRSLDSLNQRVVAAGPAEDAVTLTATRALARAVNERRLRSLRAEEVVLEGTISGVFEERDLPVDRLLRLRVGAQVMLVKNQERGRVNGSLGQVTRVGTDGVAVRFADGCESMVGAAQWERVKYRWDRKTRRLTQEVVGCFTQIPLVLAWGLTIHKAQGLTLDRVVVDVGRGAFAHGQIYVALSRVRTLDGLWLRVPLSERDMMLHPRLAEIAASGSRKLPHGD